MSNTIINHVTAELEEGLRLIPPHMHESVRLYVLHGTPHTGSFLWAILSNNFLDTVCLADDANAASLKQWAQFLCGYTPRACHGSPDKVADWKRSGGLLGIYGNEDAA